MYAEISNLSTKLFFFHDVSSLTTLQFSNELKSNNTAFWDDTPCGFCKDRRASIASYC
jgi:hypothetical protein